MKKWIIASACILTFSGYAAAQSSPAKAMVNTSSSSAKAPKKGTEASKPAKKGATNTVPEPIKLAIPRINDSDTLTSVPKTKEK